MRKPRYLTEFTGVNESSHDSRIPGVNQHATAPSTAFPISLEPPRKETKKLVGLYKMGPPRYVCWFINHEITPSN